MLAVEVFYIAKTIESFDGNSSGEELILSFYNVYGRRAENYGRDESEYSSFQTVKQFANPAR